MMNKRSILIAVLVFLPTLALGGLVLKNEASLAQAKTWRVKIEGYDPRDLLYGHYLYFRYDWVWEKEKNSDASDQACLCLQPGATEAGGVATPVVSYQSCAATQCASVMKHGEGGHRYYVPEKEAAFLERLLRKRKSEMSVDLRVTASGWTSLGELYIDGTPWRDWMRQHSGELTSQ